MKIILLGGILGNLPALEACLGQADTNGYDLIVHTGDVVGWGPFPDECFRLLRARNIPGVRGGWEEALSLAHPEAADALAATPRETDLARLALRWNLDHMQAKTRLELEGLPFEVRRDAGGRALSVFHGGPVSLMDRLLPGMPVEAFQAVLDAAGAVLVGLGRSPEPFHRQIQGRHIVSAPVLGLPGATQTGYAVITADAQIQASFPRFPYDAERAARGARDRMPPALAERFSSI